MYETHEKAVAPPERLVSLGASVFPRAPPLRAAWRIQFGGYTLSA